MRSEPPTGDELNRMLVSMKQQVLEQAANEPAPAAAAGRRTVNRGLALGVGITLFLGVGATAAYAITVAASQEPQAAPPAQTFTQVASPTPEPTPSATPAAPAYDVVPGPPASRYGLSCDTLVDSALVEAVFPVPVGSVDPITAVSGGTIAIPLRTSIMSVGGNVCEWSNGVPSDDRGAAPDYLGVSVSVVPKPAAGWNGRASAYQAPRLLDVSCVQTWACSGQAVTEHSWLSMTAHSPESSAVDAAAWSRLFEAVFSAISDAEPPAPPAFAEHTEYPGASGCEALLPVEAIRAAATKPEIEYGSRGGSGGGWSNWADADFTAGNFGCTWSDEEASIALDWVREGRWAYDRMVQAGTSEPVTIGGLGGGDQAVIRCVDSPLPACAVDLTYGPDWYNVRADDRGVAIAIAEAFVATRVAAK